VLWTLAEFHASGRPRWLLLTGAVAGLGLLAKLSVAWLGPGILLWLLRHPGLRPTVRRWQLWAGGAIALLLLLPTLLWNAGHGWPSLAPQLEALGDWRPDAAQFVAKFFFVQVMALGILPVPFLAWSYWQALRSPDPARSLPVLTALPFLVFLLFWSLHGEVLGPWSGPLYPGFALLAVLGLEAAQQRGRGFRAYLARATWRTGVPVLFAVAFVLYGYVALPGMPVIVTKETTLQSRGWDALAAEVETLRRESGAAWIATQNHATAAQLAYHLPGVPVLQLQERQRYLNLPPPAPDLLQRPALLVEVDSRLLLADLHRRFRQVELLATLERRSGDFVLRRYLAYRVAAPKAYPLDELGLN